MRFLEEGDSWRMPGRLQRAGEACFSRARAPQGADPRAHAWQPGRGYGIPTGPALGTPSPQQRRLASWRERSDLMDEGWQPLKGAQPTAGL